MVLSEIVQSPATGNALAGTVAGSLLINALGWLPVATATVALIGGTLGIVWYSIQIWESDTAGKFRKRASSRRRLKRAARLKNELKLITAELSELSEHSPTDKIAMEELAGAVPRPARRPVAEPPPPMDSPPSD